MIKTALKTICVHPMFGHAIAKPAMIRLSYTALADYMTSSAHTQRKTLFDYKYPDEDEPTAKRLYYREARQAIRAYHVGKHPENWLEEQAISLADTAAIAHSTQAASRLKSNARTLKSYSEHYSSTDLTLLPHFSGTVLYGDVQIRIVADLHAKEKKSEKIIRLDHSKDAPDQKYCSVVTQLMYEAACAAGLQLPTSSFVVRHVASRTDYKGARAGARILKDISASCANIEATWAAL
ncbi:MAG: hypothetical protein U1F71_25285 [Verrucomicrobiaceae bacterium]